MLRRHRAGSIAENALKMSPDVRLEADIHPMSTLRVSARLRRRILREIRGSCVLLIMSWYFSVFYKWHAGVTISSCDMPSQCRGGEHALSCGKNVCQFLKSLAYQTP